MLKIPEHSNQGERFFRVAQLTQCVLGRGGSALVQSAGRLAVTGARSWDKRTRTMQKIPHRRYMGCKGGYY